MKDRKTLFIDPSDCCPLCIFYRDGYCAEHKMEKKEGDMSIDLERTTDILAYLGEHKKECQFICGFCMYIRIQQ